MEHFQYMTLFCTTNTQATKTNRFHGGIDRPTGCQSKRAVRSKSETAPIHWTHLNCGLVSAVCPRLLRLWSALCAFCVLPAVLITRRCPVHDPIRKWTVAAWTSVRCERRINHLLRSVQLVIVVTDCRQWQWACLWYLCQTLRRSVRFCSGPDTANHREHWHTRSLYKTVRFTHRWQRIFTWSMPYVWVCLTLEQQVK